MDTDWDTEEIIDTNLFYFPDRLLLNGRSFVLTAPIMCSNLKGYHFTSFGEYRGNQPGVYYHDDICNNGYTTRLNHDGSFRGRYPLTTAVFYTRLD